MLCNQLHSERGVIWKNGGPDGLIEEIIDWVTDFLLNGGKLFELFATEEKNGI